MSNVINRVKIFTRIFLKIFTLFLLISINIGLFSVLRYTQLQLEKDKPSSNIEIEYELIREFNVQEVTYFGYFFDPVGAEFTDFEALRTFLADKKLVNQEHYYLDSYPSQFNDSQVTPSIASLQVTIDSASGTDLNEFKKSLISDFGFYDFSAIEYAIDSESEQCSKLDNDVYANALELAHKRVELLGGHEILSIDSKDEWSCFNSYTVFTAGEITQYYNEEIDDFDVTLEAQSRILLDVEYK